LISSVEDTEEDPVDSEEIELKLKLEEEKPKGHGRHEKMPAKWFKGPEWLLSGLVRA